MYECKRRTSHWTHGGLISQPLPLELIEHFLHQTLEAAALFYASVLKKGVFCSWISQIIAWHSRISVVFIYHAIQLHCLFANVGKIPAGATLHISPCFWTHIFVPIDKLSEHVLQQKNNRLLIIIFASNICSLQHTITLTIRGFFLH